MLFTSKFRFLLACHRVIAFLPSFSHALTHKAMGHSLHWLQSTTQSPMHAPSLRISPCLHWGSTDTTLGTAWGKGMETSFRTPPTLPSISSGMLTGQASTHAPHPVHFSSSTYFALFISLTLNFPFTFFTFLTSVFVSISIFSWLSTSNIWGASMQIEQSFVGKVLSSRAIMPPILAVSSTK